MSRFRIDHPSTEDIYAVAGVDHALGFFAEVFREDRTAPIATVDISTLGRPATMSDCFEVLMEFAFFTEDELHAALASVQDGSPSKPGDLRVVNIIMAFKQAAD